MPVHGFHAKHVLNPILQDTDSQHPASTSIGEAANEKILTQCDDGAPFRIMLVEDASVLLAKSFEEAERRLFMLFWGNSRGAAGAGA